MGKTKSKTLIFALFSIAIVLSMVCSVNAFASPSAVNLGEAGKFVILSKAGITNVPGNITSITGDMGVSPIGYDSITGFTLIPAVPNGNTFSTSSLVTGKIYASNYAEPTPTDLGVAVLDMGAAYDDALSRPSAETNPGSAGEIGGLTLASGVYTFTGSSIDVLISTDLNLNGNSTDVWIFQIPGTFNVYANVILNPGVQAKNIFWVVAGTTTIFPGFTVYGNILTAEPKTIAMQTGSILNGRALSQGAVTLDAVTISLSIEDTTAPIITINPYNNVTLTNQNINVTASTNEGTLNAESYLFTENGAFTFIATDAAGNSKNETVTITNIDKVPVITLIGTNVTLKIGNSYTELGVNVSDDYDSNVSVITNGNVNTSLIGTYIITYDAVDSSGNSAIQVTRTVSVVDKTTQSAVNLGTAGNFVILSKSGISTTGTTSIVGDIGVSPIAATGITGFGSLPLDSSGTFSTSSLVTGKIYSADYTAPTPTTMTTAIADMETAYTDASGRTLPDSTELGAGDISGMTLTPGLYKWGTGVIINNGVTLNCQANSNAIFIFQIAQDLTVGNGAIVTLSGNCQPKNIFWQVGGQTTLGTTSDFKGIILSKTLIEMNTGATLNGRALAQTAVTLDANAVTISATLSQPPAAASSSTSSSSGSGSSTGSNSGTTASTGSVGNSNTNKESLKVGDVKVETDLPMKVEGNNIQVTKSNGVKSDIKIMPSVASETAIERLKLKFCTEENNCTIILKEVGEGAEIRLAYQVKAQKNVKVFGLFKAKINVEANIDAETGEVISAHKPWWSIISTDAS